MNKDKKAKVKSKNSKRRLSENKEDLVYEII